MEGEQSAREQMRMGGGWRRRDERWLGGRSGKQASRPRKAATVAEQVRRPSIGALLNRAQTAAQTLTAPIRTAPLCEARLRTRPDVSRRVIDTGRNGDRRETDGARS